MTDRELMQQALNVLCNNVQPRDGVRDNRHLTPKSHADIYQQTIDALRDRLAQPEPLFSTPDVTPEVTPYVIDCPRCGHCCPQPNQEPVAHVEYIPCCTDQSCPKCKTATPPAAQPEQNCVGWFGYDTGVRAWFETNKGDDDSIPLYKAPRQWVELTREDMAELRQAGLHSISDYAFEVIENFLKEKNGG